MMKKEQVKRTKNTRGHLGKTPWPDLPDSIDEAKRPPQTTLTLVVSARSGDPLHQRNAIKARPFPSLAFFPPSKHQYNKSLEVSLLR